VSGPHTRETRPGPNGPVTLTRYVWAMLEAAYAEVGAAPLEVSQGSWSTSVEASGSTHAGGGAFDLRTTVLPASKITPLVHALRRYGVAAWQRGTADGMPPHVHGIDRYSPGLSGGAQTQIRDYDHGLNGLSSKRPDPDPYRPTPHPFPFTEEDPMPTPAEIAEAVWASKMTDPANGETVSARELLRRTRTVSTQGRDAAREAAANTRPAGGRAADSVPDLG
jgi:hypothetical protein